MGAKTNIVRGYGTPSRSIPPAEALRIMESPELSDDWYVAVWRHGDRTADDLLRHYTEKFHTYSKDDPAAPPTFIGNVRAQEHILIIGHFLIYSRFTSHPEALGADVEHQWGTATDSAQLPELALSLPHATDFASSDVPTIHSEDRGRLASIFPKAHEHLTGVPGGRGALR